MKKVQLLNVGRTHSGYKFWRAANITALLTILAISAFGQNVQRDEQGNFFAPAKAKALVDTTTTFTYTDSKGTVPVYKSAKGAFFVAKVSKTSGNYYRKYINTESK